MGELLKEMGQRMLDRRKQLRLTQETLAKMAHVTPQTISTAELGTKAMRPETILNVCEALDISTDYLLRGQVIEDDARLLHQKISSLTPSQYRHLEDIIDSYIAAIIVEYKCCGIVFSCEGRSKHNLYVCTVVKGSSVYSCV